MPARDPHLRHIRWNFGGAIASFRAVSSSVVVVAAGARSRTSERKSSRPWMESGSQRRTGSEMPSSPSGPRRPASSIISDGYQPLVKNDNAGWQSILLEEG
jgi:hypothetical protein